MIRKIAEQFADWCHGVGEFNPRPVTLTVWLHYNPAPVPQCESLIWEEFVRLWTSHRRHA